MKYRVELTTTSFATVVVEALDADEAKRLAGRGHGDLIGVDYSETEVHQATPILDETVQDDPRIHDYSQDITKQRRSSDEGKTS